MSGPHPVRARFLLRVVADSLDGHRRLPGKSTPEFLIRFWFLGSAKDAPASEFSLPLRAEARRREAGCAAQVIFLLRISSSKDIDSVQIKVGCRRQQIPIVGMDFPETILGGGSEMQGIGGPQENPGRQC